MKLLFVRPGPSFSVQDVHFGWRDAFRQLGVTVGDFNFDDRLDFYSSAHIDKSDGKGEFVKSLSGQDAIRLAAKGILAACYEMWPDVVMITSGFFVPTQTLETIKSRGHRLAFLFTESPYEDNRQLAYAPLADMIVVNDPTNLDAYRAQCPKTHYFPHAYNPARHHPGPPVPEMVCDFAFVGTGFPSRVEFFEQCDLEGLDVILGGSWVSLPDESPLAPFIAHRRDWCMDNDQTADLYRSCRSSLNLYRREAGHNGETIEGLDTPDGWAMGPREVELAACQTFFLRDLRGEGDEILHMLPTFGSPNEIRPLLDWWLAHDDIRDDVTLKAREAIADRTFAANAARFLQHIGD